MLPPGHIAGGYLIARITSLIVPVLNNPLFFLLTSVFAFIPDLDIFAVFTKAKKFVLIESDAGKHRRFISHAPLIYLAIYLLWLLLFPENSLIAHAFILGTWSHFILDSFAPTEHGIRWLYPFSKKPYSFNLDHEFRMPEANFFKYWLSFVKGYTRVFSFKLEMVLIALAVILLLTTN
jgi:hypothetical protein